MEVGPQWSVEPRSQYGNTVLTSLIDCIGINEKQVCKMLLGGIF